MADNFGLKIGVEGEKEFKNSLKEINSAFKVLASEMKLVSAEFDKQDKSVQAMSARNAVLNKEIDLQKEKITMLKEALKNATDSFGENDKRTQAWAVQLNNAKAELIGMEKELDSNNKALDEAGKELDDAGDEAKEFGKNVDAAGNELDDAGKEADEFGDEIDDASNKTSIFGDVLKANLAADAIKTSIKALGTLIKELAGAFKEAIDVGMEFESAFAGVKKTVDATDEQFAALEQGIRDMAMEIPASAAEISGIAEMAGQLGIQTDNILEFTRTMADLGEATNLTGEEAATTFAQFANITKMDQSDFGRMGSAIVALGNNFATTEADIAHMAQNLAAAGSQVGMSQADILGLATALSSVGIEAQAGGSAFSKVMVNMQVAVEKGGDSLADFARVAGMSTDEFSKLFKKDATSAITAFIGGLANAEASGQSAIAMLDDMGISEVRLRDSLLRAANANDLFNDAINTSNSAWEENTALTNEAAQRYETMESQLAILKNTATDFGIEIYQNVQEPMMEIVKLGQTYMKQLNDAFKEGGFGGLVEEAGTVLSDILTKVVEFAPKIIEGAVSMIHTLVEGIVAALPQITEAASQILLALVSGLIDMLPLLLEGALQIVAGLAKGIGEALPELVPAIVQAVIAICHTLIDNLPLILEAALQIILGLADGLLAALPMLIAALPTLIQSILDFIIGAIPQIIDAGVQLFISLVAALPEIIAQIIAVIPQIISHLVTAIIESIPMLVQAGIDLLVSLIQALPQIVTSIVGAIPTIINGLVTAILGNIDKIIMAGVQLLVSLITNLPRIIVEVVKAVPQIITALVKGFMDSAGKIVEVGGNLIKGLWQGIADAGAWLWGKISGFFGGIVDSIKNFFGIKSPSKVFAEIGGNLGEGIGLGFVKAMEGVSDDMQNAIPTDFDVDGNLNVNGNGSLNGGLAGAGSPLVVVQQMIVRTEDDIRRVSQELYNLMQTGSRAQGRFSPA